MGQIDGIMWRRIEGAFVLLCFCYVLLPVLTREASFGLKVGLKAGRLLCMHKWTFSSDVVLIVDFLITGHGFYDENEYDDGYAEYTGERC